MSDTTERELAVITGASSGLGAELARILAGQKYDLVITARRADRLTALRQELEAAHGIKVEIVAEDLSSATGADSLIAKVEALARPVAVLINNAGSGMHGLFVDHDMARVQEMLQLNMITLTRLTHHFARAMVARKRGRILQLSSIGAFQASPYYAAYSATKAYVLLFGEALEYELRGTGVTCTTFCPGVTETEFHQAANHPKTGLAGATMMSAPKVARIGYQAMMRGKTVVTPGILNKLTVFLVRFTPRSVVTWLAALLMKK